MFSKPAGQQERMLVIIYILRFWSGLFWQTGEAVVDMP
jgi:hypothetical protein